MSKMTFKLNRKGVSQLLRGDEMKGIVEEYGSGIQSRCGEGYKMDSQTGKTRVNAMVYPDTIPAKIKNKKENTLLKAVR